MLLSKHNIGIILSLLLIVLLSQSKLFNVFLNTYLGRTILLIFIVIISYINNILGVVVVLMIIILITSNDSVYLEGFNADTLNNNNIPKKLNNTSDKNDKNNLSPSLSDSVQPIPSVKPLSSVQPIPSVQPKTNVAQEGFDIIGTEHNIKKGKPSNSISVNSFMRNSDNVLPSESSSFSLFSSNY